MKFCNKKKKKTNNFFGEKHIHSLQIPNFENFTFHSLRALSCLHCQGNILCIAVSVLQKRAYAFQSCAYMISHLKYLTVVTKDSGVLARFPLCFDDVRTKRENCKVRVTLSKLMEVTRRPRNHLVKLTGHFLLPGCGSS